MEIRRRFIPWTSLAKCLGVLFLLGIHCSLGVLAQSPRPQFKTRAEQIEQERIAKRARLWPETESPLVEQLNTLMERGLLDGFESGKGSNGVQLVLGGMRSGQGFSAGLGYRRSDLLRDHLDVRFTARGTLQKAFMFDLQVSAAKLATQWGFFDLYVKYENSPQMDYYGPGPNSRLEDRTSYLFEDTTFDLRGGVSLWNLNIGLSGGFLLANTGRGRRGGVPSTEEMFPPVLAPGIDIQTNFLTAGAFVEFDYRDHPGGPRSGGRYAADFKYFSDRELGLHTFRRVDFHVEQYFPYFNKRRTVAIRLHSAMTWVAPTQTVPFYLQPRLGGNDTLRGFERYRFYDENFILGTVEHRWYVFAGMWAALFADVGKVAPRIQEVDFSDLEFSGGIGLRFQVRKSVVMRIDNAWSHEGFRFMWTFSNIF